MPTREQIIAELTRRGVAIPAAVERAAAPSNVPREAILAELKRRGIEPPAAEPAPTRERGFGEKVGMVGRYGLEGVADLVGLAVDPITRTLNAGLDYAGVPDGSEGGFGIKRGLPLRDAATRTADRAGISAPEGESEERWASAARGAASAALPLGPAVAGIKAVAKPLARFIPSVVSKIGGKVGQAMSAAPNVAGLAGGATAGYTGEKLRQDNASPAVQFVGSLLAGMAPSAAVAFTNGLRAFFAGNYTDSGIVRQAGERLKTLVAPGEDLDALLKTAVEQGDILPGSKLTTAQALARTDAKVGTNALMVERSLGAADSKLGAGLALREGERQGVREAALDGIAAGGDPEALAGSVTARIARLQRLGQAATQRAQSRAQTGLEQTARPIAPAVAGDVIRKADTVAHADARANTSQHYNDPVLQDAQLNLPVTQIDALMAEEFGRAPELASPKLRSLIGSIARVTNTPDGAGPVPSPSSFKEFQNLRSDLSDVAHEAYRAGDLKNHRVASKVLALVDDLNPVNPTGEEAAAFTAAKAARTDQRVRLESGPTKAMRETGSDNVAKVQGAEIPRTFFNTGPSAREDAAQFMLAYRDQPDAIEAGKRYVIQQLRENATDAGGAINAGRLAKWTEEYAEALDALDPALRPRLGQVGAAQQLADGLGERAQRTQALVDRSAAALFLKMEPDKAVAKAMNSTSRDAGLRNLAHQVRKDPDAQRGLKRAMVEYIQGKAEAYAAKTPNQGGPTIAQAGFSRAMKKYEQQLKQVFTPEEIKTMVAVQDDLEISALSNNAGRAAGSDTVQKGSIAMKLGAIGRGVKSRMGIAGDLVDWAETALKSKFIEIDDLVREAMLDPVIARELLKKATIAEQRRIIPKLQKIADGMRTSAAVVGAAQAQDVTSTD